MNRWCFLSVRVSYNDIIYWPRSDLKWKWLSLTRELRCGNMSGGVWRRGDLVVVGLSVLMLLYLLAPDCRCQSFFIKLVILFQQFHCFGHLDILLLHLNGSQPSETDWGSTLTILRTFILPPRCSVTILQFCHHKFACMNCQIFMTRIKY